jgi:hypothetical protein
MHQRMGGTVMFIINQGLLRVSLSGFVFTVRKNINWGTVSSLRHWNWMQGLISVAAGEFVSNA